MAFNGKALPDFIKDAMAKKKGGKVAPPSKKPTMPQKKGC